MKIRLMILSSLLCLFAKPLIGQSDETDPYQIRFVQTTLRTRSEGVVVAKAQPHLERMGDAVSIALLKILSDENMREPQTVEAFLPLIRDAFAQSRFIEREDDKRPKVTLFLLSHIRDNVPDIQTQQDINKTI